jgi:cobalamin biosynthesis protein CobW
MTKKIPVTVITGFLGSGKTTLIRHLLENNQGRRLAVLVNEFGALGIDGALLKGCSDCPEDNVIELTNGCLCCTVQEEFLPTMLQLLERQDEIDQILIETSGLALPKPLVKAFRWPEIRNGATVDGILTVVDAVAVASGALTDRDKVEAQRQADENLDHETPLEELFEDQLAVADLVILNKADAIDSATLSRVEASLRAELPSHVKIIHANYGKLSPDILLGLNHRVEDDLDNRKSHHDEEGEDHEHDDEIDSIVFEAGPLDPVKLLEQMQLLVEAHEIYRIKGFVEVPGKAMRLVFQGVGNRFDQYYDRPWLEGERGTKLVLIGKALNEISTLDPSAFGTSPTLREGSA